MKKSDLVTVKRDTLQECHRLLKSVRDQNLKLRNDPVMMEITRTYRSHLNIHEVERAFEKLTNLLS